jgi:hypothetical protein
VTALFQAALGNRAIPDASIGWEPVARAVRLILARDLDAEIDRQADQWAAADLQMQVMGFDPGVGQVDVEHVPIGHLHEGPHESLLDAPVSAFPNVSMNAYLNAPSGVQDHSYLTSSDITLYVETMVVAGPVVEGLETAFETIVHRRIQRTTEAINTVIQGDATLLGTVLPQQGPPRGGIGRQSWVKNDDDETGKRYLWHGSRLQYTLQRASTRGR